MLIGPISPEICGVLDLQNLPHVALVNAVIAIEILLERLFAYLTSIKLHPA